jgi:DNA-binding FadR family transcriptional regulator
VSKAAAPAAPESPAAWAHAIDDQTRRSGKLAPLLAKRIEAEVFRRGWPVGQTLGKEEELATRFSVSRTVLREALAITERDGVTRRQRGRSGGVYVAAPAQQSVVMALGNYLTSAGLSEQQYAEGYALLNGLALRLAAERCTAQEATAARELAGQPLDDDHDAVWRRVNQIHQRILAMGKNRALEILTAATVYSGMQRMNAARVDVDAAASMRYARGVLDGMKNQLECVIAGDAAAAIIADREALLSWRDCYPARAPTPLDAEQAERVAAGIAAIYAAGKPVKRVDVLALRISRDIACGNYREGEHLDNEATLLTRYGTSRGVLREAIRALEHHAVVRTAEGRGGGLRVGRPDPAGVVRSAVIYFRFLKLQATELHELGSELELALALGAAGRVRQLGPQVLDAFGLAIRPAKLPATAREAQLILEAIYAGLATASGNPFLALLVQVLTAFLTVAARRAERTLVAPATFADYLEQMRQVEAALRQGDASLARRGLLLAYRSGVQLQPQPRGLRQLLDRIYA